MGACHATRQRVVFVAGMKPTSEISLTGDEFAFLWAVQRMATVERRILERAQIVLQAHLGAGNSEIAQVLGLSRQMVVTWRARFAAGGVPALADRPRSGRPPRISALTRHKIVAMACKQPTEFGIPRSQWSIASLHEAAHRAGLEALGTTSVWRLLAQADLKPHRFRMWLYSKDPRFDEKMLDIVRLYTEGPPDGGVLLSVDEKSQIQALERIAPVELPRPGRSGRYEHGYVRHGTLCLFGAFEVKSGRVYGWMNETRKSADFLAFLDQLAGRYPDGPVHLVLDNLNTHFGPAVEAWNRDHGGRFHFHFTPTHASWLNQIEIWFGILSRQRLKNATFASKAELSQAILEYIDHWNRRDAHPFEWTFKGYPLRAGAVPVAHTGRQNHDAIDGQPLPEVPDQGLRAPVRRVPMHPGNESPRPRGSLHPLPRGLRRSRSSAARRTDSVHAGNRPPLRDLRPAAYRALGTDRDDRHAGRALRHGRGNDAARRSRLVETRGQDPTRKFTQAKAALNCLRT